ncbi:MAG: hypothetical protein SGJ20_04095 [Planctomycetota bacterium]|nr:hypothetical protein [Planctomycetota bacterium]
MFCRSLVQLASLFIVASACHFVCAAAPASPTSSVEVANQFFVAMQAKDVDGLVKLTAPTKGLPDGAVKQTYEQMLSRATPVAKTETVAHLQTDIAAVVVFREHKRTALARIDLDPMYMVKRDGKWLVLHKLTKYGTKNQDLTEAELASFEKLGAWLKEQKPKLVEILKDSP